MSAFKSGQTNGLIDFSKPNQNYRFAKTPEGVIFIPPGVAMDHLAELVEGARVELVYATAEKGLSATQIISVREPAGPTFYRGEVKFFNTVKGFGFITKCDAFPGQDIFLHSSVCVQAGVIPWDGMQLEFAVYESKDRRRAVEIRGITENVVPKTDTPPTRPKKRVARRIPGPDSGPVSLELRAD